MKLPGANLVNATLDGVTYKSVREFLNKLIKTRNLVADIYVNTHLLMSCHVSTYVTNGYIIASVDGRFRLTKEEILNSLIIHVRQANSDENIFELVTLASGIIPHVDIDTDINFCIGSVFPNNTSKLNIPNTGFKPLFTNKLPEIDLDAQPSVNPDVIVVNGITFYLNDALDTATFNADINGRYNLISWNVSADGESYESSTSDATLEITSTDALDLIAKLNAIEVDGKCDVDLSFDDGEPTSYKATKISTPVPPGPGPEPEPEEGEFESDAFSVVAGPKKARGQWPSTGTAQLTVESTFTGEKEPYQNANMYSVGLVKASDSEQTMICVVLYLLGRMVGLKAQTYNNDDVPNTLFAQDLNNFKRQYDEDVNEYITFTDGSIAVTDIPNDSEDKLIIQLSGATPARAMWYHNYGSENWPNLFMVGASTPGVAGNQLKVTLKMGEVENTVNVSVFNNNELIGTGSSEFSGDSVSFTVLNSISLSSTPINDYVTFLTDISKDNIPDHSDEPIVMQLSGGADL